MTGVVRRTCVALLSDAPVGTIAAMAASIRPVLVTGTPRSGKTRVAQVISRDDSFVHIAEPLTIWDPGGRHRSDDRLLAEDATHDVCERIRRRCVAAVEKAERSRYLDDLAYHALRIPFAHRVMPEAKIVHVIRSPREAIPEMIYGWMYRDTLAQAVARRRRNINPATLPRHAWRFLRNYVRMRVAGRRETWGPNVPGLRAFARDHSIPEVAGFQWRAMVEIAMNDLAELPDDRWIEVRRECLLADRRGEGRRIAAFCEVEDVEAVADYAESYLDPDFVYHNKVHPTDEQWEAIFDHIGPLARQLGYS